MKHELGTERHNTLRESRPGQYDLFSHHAPTDPTTSHSEPDSVMALLEVRRG